MFKMNNFIILILITFVASTSVSYAEITTWEFRTGSSNYDVENSGYKFGNLLSIDSNNDGTPELTIQAWSDTGCGWNCGSDSELGRGYASTNGSGLLNYNLDSSSGSVTGEEHVIDNQDGDTDMMLFTFTESTALTGIDIGWFSSDSDVSIVAGVAGLLMVSNFKYNSFKELNLHGKVPFVALLLIMLIFVVVATEPALVLFLVFALYALAGPINTFRTVDKVRLEDVVGDAADPHDVEEQCHRENKTQDK